VTLGACPLACGPLTSGADATRDSGEESPNKWGQEERTVAGGGVGA
jgi:hypothetical protein